MWGKTYSGEFKIKKKKETAGGKKQNSRTSQGKSCKGVLDETWCCNWGGRKKLPFGEKTISKKTPV